MRRLAASVLYLEALLVVFAIPVALVIERADATLVAVGAGALIVADVAIARLLRHEWAYAAGTALQLAVIVSGLVVPVMFFLGACFTALWFTALWLGATRPYRRPPEPEEPAASPEGGRGTEGAPASGGGRGRGGAREDAARGGGAGDARARRTE